MQGNYEPKTQSRLVKSSFKVCEKAILSLKSSSLTAINCVSRLVFPKELKTTQWYLQCLLLLTQFRFVQLLSRYYCQDNSPPIWIFIARQADRHAI